MARNKTGGSVSDYLADTSGNRLSGEKVGFYRDAACTTRITDLLDKAGAPITEVTTDAAGYWDVVQFPDDGTVFAYAARLHPSNGAPIAPGRIVQSHTAFLTLEGEKAEANGLATLDENGVVEQPVPYSQVTGVPDLSVYAKKVEVPTLEEQVAPVSLHWPGQAVSMTREGTDSIQRDTPLLCMPSDWTVLSVDLAFNNNIATSDTDYWTFTLQNFDADGTNQQIGVKTTQTTGGEALTGDKPFRFNTGALDPGGRLFGADQVLRLLTKPTGTPPDLTGPGIAVVRYARQ